MYTADISCSNLPTFIPTDRDSLMRLTLNTPREGGSSEDPPWYVIG